MSSIRDWCPHCDETGWACRCSARTGTKAPACDPVAVGQDGWSEWLHPTAASFLSQCCDCGLVHETEFQIVPRAGNNHLNPGEGNGGVIIFRSRRALASAIEARSDATGTGAAEGESAGPKDDAHA